MKEEQVIRSKNDTLGPKGEMSIETFPFTPLKIIIILRIESMETRRQVNKNSTIRRISNHGDRAFRVGVKVFG